MRRPHSDGPDLEKSVWILDKFLKLLADLQLGAFGVANGAGGYCGPEKAVAGPVDLSVFVFKEDEMTPSNAQWFAAILCGLAGAHPDNSFPVMTIGEKGCLAEAMRLTAEKARSKDSSFHPAYRSPWWLLQAYADWIVARAHLDRMEHWEYDQAFERGMNFRRYLGAWLWSMGISQLSMTAVDLEAVHDCTGVAPLPHVLLPRDCHLFLTDCFSTTLVDEVPVKHMDAANVLMAFAQSETLASSAD
jgi:hypothetical protein